MCIVVHIFINVSFCTAASKLIKIHICTIVLSQRFDQRIAEFAEAKFQRDGIDVRTGYRVVKISDNSITMKCKSTGETSEPYGMAVWSAGVGTRPVIVDVMKQIGQVSRNHLLLFFYVMSFSF